MDHRSRSPRFRNTKIEREERSFSISPLSDYDGKAHGSMSARKKSEDRNKRFLRHFDERNDKRDKKTSKTKQDNYKHMSAFDNSARYNEEHITDPSVCNFEPQIQMSHNSYVPPKSTNPNDRLDRLEKMMEKLVESSINKQQILHVNNGQEAITNSMDLFTKTSHITTSAWLNKISEECLERRYDEITCINFIQSKMSGLMKAWFKTLDAYQYTWPELKMLIIQTFPDTTDFACTLRLLVDRLKIPEETITQYYFSKMYLIEACKISGCNAVSCLIDGLSDPQIQKEAREQNYLTPESFYSDFLRNLPNFGISTQIIEPLMSGIAREPVIKERDQIMRERSHGNRDRELGMKDRNHGNRESKKRKDYDDSRAAPICFKCRQKGHIAIKCPN
ncbi:unnamed protein product [Phyllotreta striolata]|uniref:CCHC-type domain-containing protein n=1 Tax=Phyllotreta striolata TaxID=444603 RepID=A0A9N9TJK9_PHYSR|nr:unnamed protein product [Phyllotreta striolata]